MAPYLYELPTTGVFSFADICIDGTESYTTALVDATAARANLRSVLKDHKHSNNDKDYLRIIKVLRSLPIDLRMLLNMAKTTGDYLPHLYGIISCVQAGELSLRSTPGKEPQRIVYPSL